jgi:hypothetical protein
MYKQFIEYDDLDDNRQTATLFFHLRRTELVDAEGGFKLEVLEKRVEDFQRDVIGRESSEMSVPEVREFLDIIKTLVRLAYGKREGQRFIKNQELWDEFVETGRYDGLIWWLFDKPERANDFLINVWPKQVRDQLSEQGNVRQITDAQVHSLSLDKEPNAFGEELTVRPEKTDEELLQMDPNDMTQDELKRAFRLKVARGAAQD